jgi:hypothetical protein
MQVICNSCGEDVTMEIEFKTSPPFELVDSHICESIKIKALEAGYIL